MTHDPISEPVKQFILRSIDSVELLNVLLLLQKNPHKNFRLQEIQNELRSSLSAIQKRLDDLYQRKILRRSADSDVHRYLPENERVRALIEELVKTIRFIRVESLN